MKSYSPNLPPRTGKALYELCSQRPKHSPYIYTTYYIQWREKHNSGIEGNVILNLFLAHILVFTYTAFPVYYTTIYDIRIRGTREAENWVVGSKTHEIYFSRAYYVWCGVCCSSSAATKERRYSTLLLGSLYIYFEICAIYMCRL